MSSKEKAKLLTSDKKDHEILQRSLEETARSQLNNPHFLTSFDDGTSRKLSPSISSVSKSLSTSHDTRTLEKKSKWEGLTLVLLLSVMAAVLGSSTQFGFHSGVINNPKDAIRSSFGNGTRAFSEVEMTAAVSIFAIGGMVGSLPTGTIADLVGRKYTMLFNNLVILVGVALQSLAVHPIMFIMGRFVVGIGAGVCTVVVPLYLSEISPLNLRGSMGVCHQFAVVSTILLSQIFGLKVVFGRPDDEFYAWRILFGIPLLFSAFQVALLPWLPESPKYLFIKRKKRESAIKALKRLRGTLDIQAELKLMIDELAEMERPREKVSLIQFVKVPYLRRAILVSIVLHLSQQLGGINGIFYYSSDVFNAAGIPNPDVVTVVTVGVVLVLVTFVVVVLVEVVGRRTLMMYGLGGMTLSFIFFTSMFCFLYGFYGNPKDISTVTPPGVLLVVSSLGIVVLFGLGPGVMPWVMVAEFFNQEARPVALSIATIVNWLANFAVGLAFPFILSGLLPYGTLIFVGTCSVMWIYLYFFLPETKGRSIDDITSEFKAATEPVHVNPDRPVKDT